MSERRCDSCQRVVNSWDEHAGYDCEHWPEIKIGQKEAEHCGHMIKSIDTGKIGVFCYRVSPIGKPDVWVAEVPTWQRAFQTAEDQGRKPND